MNRIGEILIGIGAALLLGWLLVIALTSCEPQPMLPTAGDGCTGACAIGEALGCEWADPSPGGVACIDWCGAYHAVGYMRPWADCVAVAGTIVEIEACGVTCDR